MDASPVLRCIVSRPVASLPWNDFPFGPGAKEARPRKRVLVLDRVKAAKNSSPRAQYCASGRYVVDQVQRNLTTGAQHTVSSILLSVPHSVLEIHFQLSTHQISDNMDLLLRAWWVCTRSGTNLTTGAQHPV